MKFGLITLLLVALIAGVWYFVDSPEEIVDELPEAEEMDTDIAEQPDDLSEPDAETIEPEATEEEETAILEEDSEPEAAEPTEHEFTLDSFNYGYSEDELVVQEGDTVTINLTSSEGIHDWVLDEFDVASEQISADGETSVTFVADAAGEYEYYCSVGNHRAQGMVGTLIVE